MGQPLTYEHPSSTVTCRGKLDFSDSSASLTACEVEEELLMPMENLCRDTSSQAMVPSELHETWCSTHEMFEKLTGDVIEKEKEKEALEKKIKELEQKLEETEQLSRTIVNRQEEIIELYKDILDSGQLLGGLLSLSERNAIQEEIKKATGMFNIGFRSKNNDLIELFDPDLFTKLVNNLQKDCPTISNILEQLVLSSNASRNTKKTIPMKMKAAVHLLGSLLDVRDQHSGNDIPVLFGLLCLCYGAGPSMIEVLQHLGMSESYATLTGILRKQLEQYRDIIKKRVKDTTPIITYQDNMQLMRTSLRHLRLSKLQKEKVKQGKMWDFTVRGWREADISGIEDLFKKEETAVKGQKDVSSLEYSDIQIECNQEHYNRWLAFKERNTLKQLDFGLNYVKIDKEILLAASAKDLEKEAEEATTNSKKFKIVIPDIHEDFPSQGKKTTKIYPLPISHENQCTLLGSASNLDLFTEEFGFPSRKENHTYLPLKKSKKEFDLDKAYERYAFLKSYEKHKEQQREYEQILRGEEVIHVRTVSHNSGDDELLVAVPASDSDSEAEAEA